VTIGLTVPGTSLPEASDTLEFDPQTARVPLVFELKPLFADISGRVVGFTDEEITRVGVAFTVGERGGALVTRCAADGTFHLTRVLRGEGALLLTLAEPSPPTATVLARLPLKLEGDVAGLQLARDPSSLPEKAEQR
jgi:hypothetical protein